MSVAGSIVRLLFAAKNNHDVTGGRGHGVPRAAQLHPSVCYYRKCFLNSGWFSEPEPCRDLAARNCLVGDGNRTGFSQAQIQQLNTLVDALRRQLNLPAERVLLQRPSAEPEVKTLAAMLVRMLGEEPA